jgi:cytochrome d ubiquinol oxidase subunit II
VAASAIFALAFAGLAYSIYPYVVIDRLTIWEAAAHPSALKVLLIGAAVVLPFIVGYTILSYRIFSGKARENLYE